MTHQSFAARIAMMIGLFTTVLVATVGASLPAAAQCREEDKDGYGGCRGLPGERERFYRGNPGRDAVRESYRPAPRRETYAEFECDCSNRGRRSIVVTPRQSCEAANGLSPRQICSPAQVHNHGVVACTERGCYLRR